MGIIENLGLASNPFEHYTAETEPHISDYAVRPPYLSAIIDRSFALNSFTLFGERGSGKSATRITVFSSLWERQQNAAEGTQTPLAVNVTDFTPILEKFVSGKLSDQDLVSLTAFHIIEKILAWLASLPSEDREVFIHGLNEGERSLMVALLEAFYLSVPDMNREISTSDTLKLLNSAFSTKSQLWINKHWDSLSKVFAMALGALSRRKVDDGVDITDAAEKILKSLKSESGTAPRATLSKLVELVRAFGFSGICVLIDKVDETTATTNSAESTAKLVYPIFNNMQLLEVEGFSWIFFLWSNVKEHFSGKLHVRLDKIAHANITWSKSGLRDMVDARLRYFSEGRIIFSNLLDDDLDEESVFSELTKVAMNSPRELIKIIDIVIREHDIIDENRTINSTSLKRGLDVYCVETVDNWYPDKILGQVLRLGKISFVNKDLQTKFKIGHQGARNKIIMWEGSGIISQDGTLPSESGGKPVNLYKVSDAKVKRIIGNRLLAMVGADADEDDDLEDGDA